MKKEYVLPPMWVDTSEEVEEILVSVGQELDELLTAKNKRFKPKFDNREDEELDVLISSLRSRIYANLKKCESKLKQARQQMEQENCSESDERIIQNVQQAYLSRLNDSAKRLRQIERDHLDKMSKLYGVQGEVKLPQRSDLDVVEENRLKAASSPNKNAHTLEEISFDQAENKFDSGQAILMK